MSKKFVLLSLITVMALGAAAQAANIIWVSDNKGYNAVGTTPPVDPNVAADHGFVDLLRAQGHNVIYENEFEFIDGTQYWRTLDPNKIAELEAADLIILGRNADSGSYSTVDATIAYSEPNMWNAVSTPLLSMNFHMARSNKWGWINGTSNKEAKVAKVNVIDANHPIFAGVTIDPNGQVAMISDQWNADWILNVMDAGNGELLATRATDGVLSIATWEAGQKFFEAGTKVAGGPRMLFIGGTGSKNTNPNYAPDGMYNLTAEGEKMFINAVNFMLTKNKTIVWVAMNWDADGNTINDSQEWVDKLRAAGYTVDFRAGYWDALTDAKVVELNAADLVILSGTVQSGTYANTGEAALWNSVTAPMMNCSPYVVRSNRWKWINNGDGTLPNNNGDQGAPLLQAVATTHPIFNGIALDPNNQVQIVDPCLGSGHASFLNTADAGNGIQIGETVPTALCGQLSWIIEWPKGVEFYPGSGYFATNLRIYFSIGAHEVANKYPARGYNFTDEGWKLYLNTVAYMLNYKGKKVVYVTDSPDVDADTKMDDQGWIDWLVAEGYTVDARRSYWKEPLDVNRIAELEAADLVIASRGLASSNYDAVGEAAKWNGLKVPVLCLNIWMVRNNSNRWYWVNSVGTSKDGGSPLMMATDPTHPIFAGLPLDEDGLVDVLDPNVGSGVTSFFNDTLVDGGNGVVLSRCMGKYTSPWIIEWPAGVEFYTGAGQFTGAARMLFSAGTQDGVAGQTAPTPQGAFNLNPDGEQLLRNAMTYLMSLE